MIIIIIYSYIENKAFHFLEYLINYTVVFMDSKIYSILLYISTQCIINHKKIVMTNFLFYFTQFILLNI